MPRQHVVQPHVNPCKFCMILTFFQSNLSTCIELKVKKQASFYGRMLYKYSEYINTMIPCANDTK